MGLQTLENKVLSRGIIGKSAPILAEITIRKSQSIVFTGTHAMEDLARFEPQGACQRVLFILAWRRDLLLVAFRHPGCAAFGQQVDIEFVGKDHHLMPL
jgi:hypothetical protein